MPKSLLNFFSSLKPLLSLVLPRYCLCCSDRIESGFICDKCEGLICPANTISTGYKNITAVFSLFDFCSNEAKLIHALKYNELTQAAQIVRLYKDSISTHLNRWEIDLIVPIPLHRVKKRSRGYNQSTLIARELSTFLGIEVVEQCFFRKKFTKTQTTLSREKRFANISGAFTANSRYNLANKTILLVDDVITTGSTICEVATLAKQNKVRKIYGFTLAKAQESQ